MSVIIACKKDGYVYLGADTQTTGGETKIFRDEDPANYKIWVSNNGLIIGCSGSYNALLFFGDILKNRALVTNNNASFGALLQFDASKGMNSYFITRIRKYFNSYDWDNFGKKFDCDYIFFYDDKTHDLWYSKWNGFINAQNLKKWF